MTAETNENVKRIGELLSKRMTGQPGHKPSKETRQKMSRSASERSFANNARVKWHEVFNPTTNIVVKVQGTWEKRYAEWLNAQGTKWERPQTTFKWRRNGDDIEHTYHPDFYLPETDTYVDIKGYMWKDVNKNIDDELKLRLVREQNPTVKLEVLMKYDLRQMGVL